MTRRGWLLIVGLAVLAALLALLAWAGGERPLTRIEVPVDAPPPPTADGARADTGAPS